MKREEGFAQFIGYDTHRVTLQAMHSQAALQAYTKNRRTGKPDAAISYSSNNLMNQALSLRLTTDS
jgi:hypothetical protein